MINFNSIMIGSSQPTILTEFYEKIIGRNPDMKDGEWAGWQIGNAFFSIGPHSELQGKAKEPARVMFNFETEEIDSEFERMVDIGAVVIKEPYTMGDMTIATLADPDGNYFQLMTPWDEEPKELVN